MRLNKHTLSHKLFTLAYTKLRVLHSERGVKRARAVVHTTALRNRVAATIPALATLSVSNADALTVSTVRSKLKLSHIPITTAPPPDLTAPPQPRHSTPISMPPVPPKDHLEPPQSLSTPNSDVGSTSTYFTSDSRDEMQLQSEADALRPLHPSFQTKKRVPSPIMVPTDATPTLRGNNETHLQSPGADTSSGPSFLTYLQNGSAPNSPVQSTVRKPEQKPLPNSPLSPGLDSIHPPTSPASHNTTDDLIDQYASPLSPRGVPDSFVPDSTEEARTESPRHSNGRSDPEPYNFGYRESDQAQSSNTLTDISQDLSRSERPSSRPADFSPPSRSSSLMHSLSSSQGGPREPFEPERRHARGPSNASSNAVSPAQDEYTESISTSIATTADDSSSSPRVSLHQNSRDAALDAELKRQAAWDADAPRRNALPLAEQKLLERNELERRAAAERQRKEIQWRLAMAQQEQSAAEDEERREREAAEQREKEAEAQRLREEEAERAKAEAEEKKRQAAEAKAARQMELKNQFESLSLQEGAIILNGFVSVQQVNSTLWRRRWFELQRQQLRLFKDSNVRAFGLSLPGRYKL